MFKPSLSFVCVALLSVAAQAELAPPVIQRDAKGVVTITAAPGAVIYYTVDGSEPNPKGNGGVYLAPIQLPFKAVVKAKAYDSSTLATLEVQGDAPVPPSTIIPITQNRNWSSYDWVQRHNTLCALVRERKPALVFIGDSITHQLEGKDVWRKYYEPRNAVDLGFGWDRTENVLWRLQHGELEGVEPKVAVIMIGTNNSGSNQPADIAIGIRAICTEIHQRTPNTKILLLGIFPRGEKPDDGRKRIDSINSLIAAFDGQDGITFLDIGTKFLNPDGTISKEIMGDFLHPTPKGQEIWAEAMEPTLKKLLGE